MINFTFLSSLVVQKRPLSTSRPPMSMQHCACQFVLKSGVSSDLMATISSPEYRRMVSGFKPVPLDIPTKRSRVPMLTEFVHDIPDRLWRWHFVVNTPVISSRKDGPFAMSEERNDNKNPFMVKCLFSWPHDPIGTHCNRPKDIT
jgi:hypothetical protein